MKINVSWRKKTGTGTSLRCGTGDYSHHIRPLLRFQVKAVGVRHKVQYSVFFPLGWQTWATSYGWWTSLTCKVTSLEWSSDLKKQRDQLVLWATTGCSGYLTTRTEKIIRLTLPWWKVSYNTCAHVNTCYFSDSAEHFQLFGIQGWNVFKIISVKIKKRQCDADSVKLFSGILGAAADNYPTIPVTRKWRLPCILVQLMKLSMLLESTVCLCSAPVPSHTAGTSEYHR